MPEENIFPVTDYISKEFLSLKNTPLPPSSAKENLITYYAPKSNVFTTTICKDLAEKYNYSYLPLESYSTEELINILKKSKIFLDFSFFPGRNKMHREASGGGNIVLTSNLGAAKRREDVNIKDEYKFDIGKKGLEEAEKKIVECIENFDEKIKDFDEHREEAFREKEVFDRNIKGLAEKLKNDWTL